MAKVQTQKFKLTAAVVFRDGYFKLSEDQLARRVNQVSKQLDGEYKGLYTPLQPIQFKAGETIEIVDLPKSYWASTEVGQALIDKRSGKDPEGDDPPHDAETAEEKAARLKAEEEAKKAGGQK
jgi:hypothetical protein